MSEEQKITGFTVRLYGLLQSMGSLNSVSLVGGKTTLQMVIDKMAEIAKMDVGLIMTVKENKMVVTGSYDLDKQGIIGTRLQIGEDDISLALKKGCPAQVKTKNGDSTILDKFKNLSIETVVIIPLIGRKRDEAVGVMVLGKKDTKQYLADDLELMNIFAQYASLAIENAILHEKVKLCSVTDGMTGLYNHSHFEKVLRIELGRADRFSQYLSLIMLDIDHFKKFNDQNGHVAGDRALKQVADIIKNNVRKIDVVARYGGEEFIIILPQTFKVGASGAYPIAERIRCLIERQDFGITISAGIATYPLDATDPEELVIKADKALYLAKNSGRNRAWQY